MLFFCASICQSLPLALGVSNVAQILCLMEYGILNAFAPICAGKLLSSCAKKAMVSLSFYTEDKSKAVSAALGSDLDTCRQLSIAETVPSMVLCRSQKLRQEFCMASSVPEYWECTLMQGSASKQSMSTYIHVYIHVLLPQGCLWTENASNCIWGPPDSLQMWQQKTKQPGGCFTWLVKELSKAFKIVSFFFHRSFVYGGVTKCDRAVEFRFFWWTGPVLFLCNYTRLV